MMNKTGIEWCDFSWNPVTGCRRGCPYCFAERQAKRFCGDIRLNKTSEQLLRSEDGFILERAFKGSGGKVVPLPAGFEPTLHRYRLPMPAQKKKPANIFVCSMADLFAPWVPTAWIGEVMDACAAAPWHNYLFLTKYPERYEELEVAGALPLSKNHWYGTTVTQESEFDRVEYLVSAMGPAGTFISLEPLQEPLDLVKHGAVLTTYVDWIIAGAETGRRIGKAAPERGWFSDIVNAARLYKIPVFLKDSAELKAVWGDELPQELPEELRRPPDAPIPHCSECASYCKTVRGYNSVHDVELMNHRCGEMGKTIPGRYVRSSPPWCPKR